MMFCRALLVIKETSSVDRRNIWRYLGEELQGRYQRWREKRDVAAITAALERLSERRLNLIGLHHSTLESDVQRMIWDTEAGRRIIESDVL